jgi:hypothetical protein
MCLLMGAGPAAELARTHLKNWSVTIRDAMNVQVEQDGSLVLWTKGRTIFLAERRAAPRSTISSIRNHLVSQTDAEALCIYDYPEGALRRYAYSVRERTPTTQHLGIYTYTIASGAYLELVFYLENEDDLEWALKIWQEATHLAPGVLQLTRLQPPRYYRSAGRRAAPSLVRA